MTLTREQMLAEMGISPIWVLRDGGSESMPTSDAVPDQEPLVEAPVVMASEEESVPEPVMQQTPSQLPLAKPENQGAASTMDWPTLAEAVADCRACGLCQQRKQAVLGVGDRQAEWLFIGEGPGAEEDARGEPFVGQAGKLLDNMLASLDLARGNRVYIANAVKCRPPGNRAPEPAEMAACRPWLERQIELLKPKIIVLLGKAAVHTILHEDKALAALRGRVHEHAGIPVVVTYHPAYLLRNLPDKAKAWEDLLLARRTLRARG